MAGHPLDDLYIQSSLRMRNHSLVRQHGLWIHGFI